MGRVYVELHSAMSDLQPDAAADDAPTSFASLDLDGTTLVLRQMSSILDVMRLAVVSSTFAAATRATLATLEHLELAPEMCGDDESLSVWLSHAPALVSLELGGLKELLLVETFCFSTKLQRLGLSETQIDATGLLGAWTSLPLLIALDLTECSYLEGSEVEELVTAPPASKCLAELSLARCARVTAATACHLCCLIGASLTNIDLGGYDDFGSENAQRIFEACGRGLRRLSLNESEGLDEASVTHLATSAAELRVLDLSWCVEVGTGAVQTLGAHCPMLMELELRCCSGIEAVPAIAAIGRGCEHLNTLCLNRTGCSTFVDGDGGDDAPIALITPLLRLHRLLVLDLGWLMELVTDESFGVLLRGLPLLSVLSVEGCKALTDRALDALISPTATDAAAAGASASTEVASRLVRLNFAWVDGVSDAAMHAALRSAHARVERSRQAHGRARRPDERLRGAELQILDYYGRCWGVDADGQPAKCKLRLMGRGLPKGHPLKGWVNAHDADDAAEALAQVEIS